MRPDCFEILSKFNNLLQVTGLCIIERYKQWDMIHRACNWSRVKLVKSSGVYLISKVMAGCMLVAFSNSITRNPVANARCIKSTNERWLLVV